MGSYFSHSVNMENSNDNDGEIDHALENCNLQDTKDQHIKEQHRQIKELKNTIELMRYEKKLIQHDTADKVIKQQQTYKNIVKNISENKKNKKYEYLILAGGGIKGLSYCGAIEVLEKHGILKNIKGYGGSS